MIFSTRSRAECGTLFLVNVLRSHIGINFLVSSNVRKMYGVQSVLPGRVGLCCVGVVSCHG